MDFSFLQYLGFGVAALAGGISAYLMKVYKMGKYLDEPVEAPIMPVVEETPPSTTSITNKPPRAVLSSTDCLYNIAYSCLGQHLSLDDEVPPEVGCAQAVSQVLLKCEYKIPKKGISTVSGLTDWMLKNGFKEVSTYEKGLVITGRAPSWAHIGITGKTHIMSNTSETLSSKGLFRGQFQANYKRSVFNKVFPIVHLYTPPPVV